jgi:hypothetical protein
MSKLPTKLATPKKAASSPLRREPDEIAHGAELNAASLNYNRRDVPKIMRAPPEMSPWNSKSSDCKPYATAKSPAAPAPSRLLKKGVSSLDGWRDSLDPA